MLYQTSSEIQGSLPSEARGKPTEQVCVNGEQNHDEERKLRRITKT